MNQIDDKILTLIDILKTNGSIRFDTDFCIEIGLKKQNLNRIKNKEAHFTVAQIKSICDIFNINTDWIFGYSNVVFRDKKTTGYRTFERQ